MSRKNKIYGITVVLLMLLMLFTICSDTNEIRAAGPSRPKVTVGKRGKKTVILKLRSSSTVTSYQIYMKKGKKGRYQLVDFAMGRNVDRKLKKLKPKETYYVKVRSVRARGTYFQKSAFSKVMKIAPYYKKKKKKTVPTPVPVPSVAPTVKPTVKPTATPLETPAVSVSTGVPVETAVPTSAAMPAETAVPTSAAISAETPAA